MDLAQEIRPRFPTQLEGLVIDYDNATNSWNLLEELFTNPDSQAMSQTVHVRPRHESFLKCAADSSL